MLRTLIPFKQDGYFNKFTMKSFTVLLIGASFLLGTLVPVRALGNKNLPADTVRLRLENLSHPELNVSIISLDPPPLKLDRKIVGLKRVEIRLPAYLSVKRKVVYG